jgi:CDP-diglyceride synthetase
MLLFPQWPHPPKMDAHAYRSYQLSLLGYIVAWLCAAVAIIFFWQSLPLLFKALAVIIACVITPDVGMLEHLFMSYERYSREGLM